MKKCIFKSVRFEMQLCSQNSYFIFFPRFWLYCWWQCRVQDLSFKLPLIKLSLKNMVDLQNIDFEFLIIIFYFYFLTYEVCSVCCLRSMGYLLFFSYIFFTVDVDGSWLLAFLGCPHSTVPFLSNLVFIHPKHLLKNLFDQFKIVE